MLVEARALPVWGFPWTSNPWCRLTLGSQVRSACLAFPWPAVLTVAPQCGNPCCSTAVSSAGLACQLLPQTVEGFDRMHFQSSIRATLRQAETSRRDDDTSHAGRHRAPVWNQACISPLAGATPFPPYHPHCPSRSCTLLLCAWPCHSFGHPLVAEARPTVPC